MRTPSFLVFTGCVIAAASLLAVAGGVRAGDEKAEAPAADEQHELQDATDTVKEIIGVPEGGIPHALLDEAAAIAIIPDVVKAGLVAGARHGDGVMVIRQDDGHWSHPMFVDLTGASVGWQAGVEATDVVLVFKNGDAARKVIDGEFTLGADGSIAAGPVGREASA